MALIALNYFLFRIKAMIESKKFQSFDQKPLLKINSLFKVRNQIVLNPISDVTRSKCQQANKKPLFLL